MSLSMIKALYSLGIVTVLFSYVIAHSPAVAVPKLVHIATGTIDLGKPLSPIPIPGGVRLGKSDIRVSASRVKQTDCDLWLIG